MELNTSDSVAVENYTKVSNLCERIVYAQKNTSKFIEKKSYAKLILISISKDTHRNISIPLYNHQGQEIENQNKEKMISTQMNKLFVEFCE